MRKFIYIYIHNYRSIYLHTIYKVFRKKLIQIFERIRKQKIKATLKIKYYEKKLIGNRFVYIHAHLDRLYVLPYVFKGN